MVRFYLACAFIILWSACFAAVALASEVGLSSWYGTESGNRTATGEHFNGSGDTCAHRSLRFGTILEVTNLQNGRRARCRVNDRGPARWTHRSLDVSRAVAVKLRMVHSGVVNARWRIVGHARKR